MEYLHSHSNKVQCTLVLSLVGDDVMCLMIPEVPLCGSVSTSCSALKLGAEGGLRSDFLSEAHQEERSNVLLSPALLSSLTTSSPATQISLIHHCMLICRRQAKKQQTSSALAGTSFGSCHSC